jgi:hypothetical protein
MTIKAKEKPTETTPIKIEDRLLRRAPEDKIYIGQIVEQALQGELGSVLKALTAGRIAETAANKSQDVSNDEKLGQIQAFQRIWDDLEQFVIDKDTEVARIIAERGEEPEEQSGPSDE